MPKKIAQRHPTGTKAASTRPASLGLTVQQKQKIYELAARAGFNVQMGPRSQLGKFIDRLIVLAEAAEPTASLTPAGQELFDNPAARE